MENLTLTPELMKTFAAATSITFRREEIQINREIPAGDGWDATTQSRTLPILSTVTDYRAHHYSRRVTPSDYECYYTAYNFGPLAMLQAILKSGDELHLQWDRDNNATDVAAAGFHEDELHVRVYRGKKQFDVLVAYSVRPTGGSRIVECYGVSEVPAESAVYSLAS